jgi:hypothetical protein
MAIELPRTVEAYIDASNAHDVQSILACFAEGAVVRDEGGTMEGHDAIERWISETIDKYQFQFKPLAAQRQGSNVEVSVEVSGTFPGSPVQINYQFAIDNDKITSLTIT